MEVVVTENITQITDQDLQEAWKSGTMWDILPTQEVDEYALTDDDSEVEVREEDREKIVRNKGK